MSDQQFPIFLQSQQYNRLKKHEQNNKSLIKANEKLSKELKQLNARLRQSSISNSIRDAFIDYLSNQINMSIIRIFHQKILSQDIMQSCYQQIKVDDPNIMDRNEKIRDGMFSYLQKYHEMFVKLKKIQNKCEELQKNISELSEQKLVEFGSKIEEKEEMENKEEEGIGKISSQMNEIKLEISQLLKEKNKLREENSQLIKEQLMLKNDKKVKGQAEKGHFIKLLISDYVKELRGNLVQMGGLTDKEIDTVIQNQIKGFLNVNNCQGNKKIIKKK